MQSAEWKQLRQFPLYEINELGDIRRISGASGTQPGRLIKHNYNSRGYAQVSLSEVAGRQISVQVHRLVALTFLGPPPKGRPWALHKDGNRKDPRISNVYWGSPNDNSADRERHGNRERKVPVADLPEIGQLCLAGAMTAHDIARKYGVHEVYAYRLKKRAISVHLSKAAGVSRETSTD